MSSTTASVTISPDYAGVPVLEVTKTTGSTSRTLTFSARDLDQLILALTRLQETGGAQLRVALPGEDEDHATRRRVAVQQKEARLAFEVESW